MAKHKTLEVIGIIEDSPVTGVKYGPIVIPQTVVKTNELETARHNFKKLHIARQTRNNKTRNK